jgi:hypothetical protein
VGFGALAVFTTWIPLSAFAGWIAAHVAAQAQGDEARLAWAGTVIALLYAVALALGAGAGGFLVGRWGTQGVGLRQAALAGLCAAAVALAVTWIAFGLSASSLLLAVAAPPMAALGGKLGLRGRAR